MGNMSTKKELSRRGLEFCWVVIVSLCLRLTKVNSLFMLAIVIGLKTFYLNAAPPKFGVHTILTESLLMIHVACENLTSLSPLAQVYSTLLVLSLISRLLKQVATIMLFSQPVLNHLQWYLFGWL